MTYVIGDARTALRKIPDGAFQCCVTSPPYWGLRDYGHTDQIGLEPTPQAYVDNMVAVFRDVRRVIANDGVLWLNLGDSYANTSAGAGGKGKQWTNHGTVQMRGRSKAIPEGIKAKDLMGIPWRVAFALQADGWYLRSDVIWAKPNPMPESVTDRPTKAHEYVFLLAKSAKYFYDAKAISEKAISDHPSGNGYARGERLSFEGRGQTEPWTNVGGDRNARTVWTMVNDPYPGAHFATMPTALVTRCILAGSRIGDTVLDPFLGSGTVGQVAESLGRRWFGVELNPEYEPLIKKRTAQQGLFAKVLP